MSGCVVTYLWGRREGFQVLPSARTADEGKPLSLAVTWRRPQPNRQEEEEEAQQGPTEEMSRNVPALPALPSHRVGG